MKPIKRYILFMSHAKGDKGITSHIDIDGVLKEVDSVINLLHGEDNPEIKTDKDLLEAFKKQLSALVAGNIFSEANIELSDGTWGTAQYLIIE